MLRLLSPLLLVLLLTSSCQQPAPPAPERSLDDILSAEYDEHFISSGNNFPQISLQENNRYKFLIGLHNGFSTTDVQQALSWSDSLLENELDLLTENGYLKSLEGRHFPAISLIMQQEGKAIFAHAERAAQEIAKSLIEREDEIKQMYGELDIAGSQAYETMSFFILSDVLLDNWQINNVERDFMKYDRPLRHGKRYYIQYAELDPANDREVFGIYGNQYNCSNNVCYITYGNNRPNHYKSFEELEALDIPVLSKSDQASLKDMASYYTPALIQILDNNRAGFEELYNNSTASKETSFEEYFIWYYHFLYTRATDILHEKGHLTVPETGIFRVKLGSN